MGLNEMSKKDMKAMLASVKRDVKSVDLSSSVAISQFRFGAFGKLGLAIIDMLRSGDREWALKFQEEYHQVSNIIDAASKAMDEAPKRDPYER